VSCLYLGGSAQVNRSGSLCGYYECDVRKPFLSSIMKILVSARSQVYDPCKLETKASQGITKRLGQSFGVVHMFFRVEALLRELFYRHVREWEEAEMDCRL
jgi:hypothetical protein